MTRKTYALQEGSVSKIERYENMLAGSTVEDKNPPDRAFLDQLLPRFRTADVDRLLQPENKGKRVVKALTSGVRRVFTGKGDRHDPRFFDLMGEKQFTGQDEHSLKGEYSDISRQLSNEFRKAHGSHTSEGEDSAHQTWDVGYDYAFLRGADFIFNAYEKTHKGFLKRLGPLTKEEVESIISARDANQYTSFSSDDTELNRYMEKMKMDLSYITGSKSLGVYMGGAQVAYNVLRERADKTAKQWQVMKAGAEAWERTSNEDDKAA